MRHRLREVHGEIPQNNFDVEHGGGCVRSGSLRRRREQSSESTVDFGEPEPGASGDCYCRTDGIADGGSQQRQQQWRRDVDSDAAVAGLRAALKGRLMNELIVDEPTATELLKQP